MQPDTYKHVEMHIACSLVLTAGTQRADTHRATTASAVPLNSADRTAGVARVQVRVTLIATGFTMDPLGVNEGGTARPAPRPAAAPAAPAAAPTATPPPPPPRAKKVSSAGLPWNR